MLPGMLSPVLTDFVMYYNKPVSIYYKKILLHFESTAPKSFHSHKVTINN